MHNAQSFPPHSASVPQNSVHWWLSEAFPLFRLFLTSLRIFTGSALRLADGILFICFSFWRYIPARFPPACTRLEPYCVFFHPMIQAYWTTLTLAALCAEVPPASRILLPGYWWTTQCLQRASSFLRFERKSICWLVQKEEITAFVFSELSSSLISPPLQAILSLCPCLHPAAAIWVTKLIFLPSVDLICLSLLCTITFIPFPSAEHLYAYILLHPSFLLNILLLAVIRRQSIGSASLADKKKNHGLPANRGNSAFRVSLDSLHLWVKELLQFVHRREI